ncbi:hypothetical protein ACIRP2_05735 [Streptomyces sp. NPDC101194]|uniref:hypothetical protein n=1 Tax=Streptomyces sp. NPDC101194 TaxID=3366127 RepID=UPI0038183B96
MDGETVVDAGVVRAHHMLRYPPDASSGNGTHAGRNGSPRAASAVRGAGPVTDDRTS